MTVAVSGYEVIATASAGFQPRPVTVAVTERQVQEGEVIEVGEIGATPPRNGFDSMTYRGKYPNPGDCLTVSV